MSFAQTTRLNCSRETTQLLLSPLTSQRALNVCVFAGAHSRSHTESTIRNNIHSDSEDTVCCSASRPRTLPHEVGNNQRPSWIRRDGSTTWASVHLGIPHSVFELTCTAHPSSSSNSRLSSSTAASEDAEITVISIRTAIITAVIIAAIATTPPPSWGHYRP